MKKDCEVEVFSRVTGFFRPVQSWNKGKTEEFGDRARFDLEKPAEKDCLTK
jgi:ribonucleoside-triphosphate reductase (formate)